MDFSKQDSSNSKWVLYYWTAGTTLTASVMFLSMFYITVEWCQQSFLSTEDYTDAMQGLRRTRSYRQYTYFVRIIARFVARYTLDPLEWLAYKVGLIKTTQQTLLWTKEHTWSPRIPQRLQPPTFELTDLTGGSRSDYRAYETPALAHSLFPPAIPMGRSRTSSDISLRTVSSEHHQYMESLDSSTRLIQRPPDTHIDLRSDPSPSEERRSSGEYIEPSTDASNEHAPFSGWLGLSAALQPRHTYRRANSDPGNPPFETPQLSQDAACVYQENPDLERGAHR